MAKVLSLCILLIKSQFLLLFFIHSFMSQQKQKNKTNDQNQKQENNEIKNNNNNKKEDETKPTTVILKVDMHCDGCASKIVKCIRGFQGFFFVSSILTKINQYFFINCFIGYILFNFIYWIVFLFLF